MAKDKTKINLQLTISDKVLTEALKVLEIDLHGATGSGLGAIIIAYELKPSKDDYPSFFLCRYGDYSITKGYQAYGFAYGRRGA